MNEISKTEHMQLAYGFSGCVISTYLCSTIRIYERCKREQDDRYKPEDCQVSQPNDEHVDGIDFRGPDVLNLLRHRKSEVVIEECYIFGHCEFRDETSHHIRT